jgi:hypothetical protein
MHGIISTAAKTLLNRSHRDVILGDEQSLPFVVGNASRNVGRRCIYNAEDEYSCETNVRSVNEQKDCP